MEKLFWESFNDTGRLDLYLLYKEFKQEQELQKHATNQYQQPFQAKLEGEKDLI